jgi:lipoprotein-anchoring transpeptidase ErfK/SrfK
MSFMRIRALSALTLVALISACTSVTPKAAEQAQPPAAPVPLAELAMEPAADTAGVPISAEIGLAVANGTLKSVTLSDAAGSAIAGRLRDDGSSWIPDQPLAFSTRYTATAIAAGQDGKEVTKTTAFTTMAEPGHRVGTGLYMHDGNEYGVAMPVVVEFTDDVEDSAKAAVEKRLFVTTEPEQKGVWAWAGSHQVEYRAQEYWIPGTKITIRAALDGQPLGGGKFGDTDRRATAHITRNPVELFIDNGTKHLTVKENGVATRSMPVSLGKPSTPSSSGKMVIMDKQVQTVFDTTGEPGDQYRVDISYAQRLTWGGEFIHAAPWSVGDQGYNNVSHGCINMSWDNAEWLFGVTHVGDPVVVTGTEVALGHGNGFTSWNRSWSEHVKGSALPQR